MNTAVLMLVLALAAAAQAATMTLELSAAEVQAIEDPYPEATLGDSHGKLAGFFVIPCQQSYPVDGRNVSFIQTRYYAHDTQTYQIDTTYYIDDANCRPSESAVYLKTYFEGTVTYLGKNKVIPGASMANLTWTKGTYYFSSDGPAQYEVNLLNHYCPCGGEWKVDEFRTVEGKDCDPLAGGAPRLCHIIAGEDDLFNYKWLDDKHYVTSEDCFDDSTTCFNNPLIPSFERERIPESGNNNPESCDYKLWAKCGAGVTEAAKNCESCQGLECDGCLFRELNPNWDPRDPSTDYNDWYDCCPCIYYYASRYEKAWAETLC